MGIFDWFRELFKDNRDTTPSQLPKENFGEPPYKGTLNSEDGLPWNTIIKFENARSWPTITCTQGSYQIDFGNGLIEISSSGTLSIRSVREGLRISAVSQNIRVQF